MKQMPETPNQAEGINEMCLPRIAMDQKQTRAPAFNLRFQRGFHGSILWINNLLFAYWWWVLYIDFMFSFFWLDTFVLKPGYGHGKGIRLGLVLGKG